MGDSDDSWKVIPNSYLSEHVSLHFLRKCNYSAESINKCLPNFYRELLQYFQEIKNKFSVLANIDFGTIRLLPLKIIPFFGDPGSNGKFFTYKMS